jgi:hypothetical protein
VEKYAAALTTPKARMGRPPYPLISFFRSGLAKRYFDIEKTSNLISGGLIPRRSAAVKKRGKRR